MRRVHVVISGRVQGVFYRASCAERARALGLAGWIRNSLEGDVEAEFEGEDDAVDAILAWCREGPRHASVETVETSDRPPLGEHGFRVTR